MGDLHFWGLWQDQEEYHYSPGAGGDPLSLRDGSGTDRAGADEPVRQCGGRHAGGWRPLFKNDQYQLSGYQNETLYSNPGRLYSIDGHRYGCGNGFEDSGPYLRSFLYDQRIRKRNRVRIGLQLWHHQRPRRLYRSGIRERLRVHLQNLPPCIRQTGSKKGESLSSNFKGHWNGSFGG